MRILQTLSSTCGHQEHKMDKIFFKVKHLESLPSAKISHQDIIAEDKLK